MPNANRAVWLMGTVKPMQGMRDKIQKVAKVIGLALVAYVAAYAVNSALGGYWLWMSWEPMRAGMNPRDRMQKTAAIRWQPRFGYYDRLWRSDALGYLFAPLIGADRQWVHRSHFAADPDFDAWWENLPPGQVHPKFRHEVTRLRGMPLR